MTRPNPQCEDGIVPNPYAEDVTLWPDEYPDYNPREFLDYEG